MISRLHSRLGTAGFTVAIIALVLALTGAAVAASGALTSKQKKEVEKIAKKYAGKPGANGTNGTNGSAGANGKDGAPGAKGDKGDKGEKGDTGKNGTSVIAEEFVGEKEGHCKVGNGGVQLTAAAGKTYACNGSPWTAGGTLPEGATETGVWTLSALPKAAAGGTVQIPISFPIPLATAPVAWHIFEGVAIPTPDCSATVEGGFVINVRAAPGNLCIYVRSGTGGLTAGVMAPFDAETGAPEAVGRTGATVRTTALAEGAQGFGTWAVTAGP